MKKITVFLMVFMFFSLQSYAVSEDDSIVDELSRQNTQELDLDYSLKTFDSCDVFEDVMEEYIKSYWENNYKGGYFGEVFPEVMEMQAVEDAATSSNESTKGADGVGGGGDNDFSSTNTQVDGVDESDIVKTDGAYHYYYNASQQAVYIIATSKSGFFQSSDLKIIKKINLPKTFYNPQLYIDEERLVIIASGSSSIDYANRGYYINRNTKTYTIVFDISDKENPSLLKLYSNDGDFTKSRKIGDYIYVLSRNYMNFPYWNYTSLSDIEIDAKSILPKKLDISQTGNISQQNLEIGGKKYPYNVTSGDVADCNAIRYNLPDEDTLSEVGFNPGYNIISVIDINNTENTVQTQVIAGSNNEVYMSQDNLYLTEGMWQGENFSCPPDAICAMPFFWGGTQNTLIHKLNISDATLEYQESALVPGAPLNQYSMDEHEGNFRIITSQWSPERSTGLYILDENLNSLSNLTNLAPGETFQSSRFMGDKLFLVTFEQIDPLFAIDLSDETNPTVLGELKIPGFSSYLHPYDENHLIGLGYDTQINQWGGTQTSGVKVDLYKINYDKKCGDAGLSAVQEEKCKSGDYKEIIVEQLYTQTLGGKGSYSEALHNPRMFIWNQNRNTLLLPITLYEKDDSWRTLDYYNGLASISINKDSGIKVNNKISHIDTAGLEEKRKEECSKYSGTGDKPVCRELINGEIYCEESSTRYVPNYCYKDASIWQYIGDKSWDFRDMQIQRALYIGDEVYALSDSMIGSYTWDLEEKSFAEFE